MGKYRISQDKKARSTPVSLKPEHIRMLQELERHMGKNRSKVIQSLIEKAYKDRFL